MSHYKLDIRGRRAKTGKNAPPLAVRMEHGVKLNRYVFKYSIKQKDGTFKYFQKMRWLGSEGAAEEYERSLKREAPINQLTWIKAHALWCEGTNFSEGHYSNAKTTMKEWMDDFGANSTIEDTTLSVFSAWVDAKAKSGTGRAAQIKRGHLLAIARWCRKRGHISSIPFNYSPKPEARMKDKPPAKIDDYRLYIKSLPAPLSFVWELLGQTGMRLGAACSLLEEDIEKNSFTVTTKGNQRVTYPITPPVRKIFDQARRWKRKLKFSQCPYLFCNTVGGRWTSTTIGRRFKEAGTKKGLPHVTAHQLRHMVGTLLGEANLSENIIMAGLGHLDRKSTQVYVDKTQTMRTQAMDTIVTKLSQTPPKNTKTRVILNQHQSAKITENIEISCPCCQHKLLLVKKIKPQP